MEVAKRRWVTNKILIVEFSSNETDERKIVKSLIKYYSETFGNLYAERRLIKIGSFPYASSYELDKHDTSLYIVQGSPTRVLIIICKSLSWKGYWGVMLDGFSELTMRFFVYNRMIEKKRGEVS